MSMFKTLSATIVTLVMVSGCTGQQGPDRLKTIPVRGVVNVKGLPASQLTVRFHPTEKPVGDAAIYAARPTAMTGGDGSFAMSTYVDGDGVAPGTYRITFEWLTFNVLRNSYDRPDKLNGKYADAEASEFSVTVVGDESEGIELPPFDLTP